ncbi:MAG: dTDP-4-dehydrorhamnose reductase [Candidatus Zixiibacteriota bacterium]|nr:MAG: dTDP-4-dehydrorhamnose reductase [candidate division Zixibacteria bacterium]
MKKVLLLGAAGQLGTGIRKVFAETPIEVTSLTRTEFDADIDTVEPTLEKYVGSDYVINCIAFHKVDQCEKSPWQSFKINAELLLDLSQYCDRHDITLIHLSTDYVFDGKKQDAYVETDLPGPLNVYGTSKLAGEMIVKAYAPKHFVLRVSSMFGDTAGDDPNVNFVEKMIDAARRGKELRVIDDQIMSPTHTEDVARLMGAIVENEVTDYGLYHACNSGECSWFEFAETIFELTGLQARISPITYTEFHAAATRPQYCSMDNSKASGILQIKPWQEALRDYLRIKGYIKQGED